MIERRALLGALAGSLLVAPLPTWAQPAGRIPVVGILNSQVGPRSPTVDGARQGLRELGYVEGQNIALEIRFAGGKPETFPRLAAELVQRRVDVLLLSGPAALRAARDATSSIPIVALDLETDPVAGGYAQSLSRPGGNVTGFFLDQPGLTGKWLELIKAVAPRSRRVGVLWDSTTGPWQLAAAKAAAPGMGLELQVLEVRSAAELDRALEAGIAGGVHALVQLSAPIFDVLGSPRIAAVALKHRLPAVSMFRRFAEVGGLMAYGPRQGEYARRLAVYVDKILKGARPGDLPIEQPAKFDFVINLKTAKALGLTFPQSLLVRADEVIQ